MFTVCEVPSSTSLLLQCGYRSKICTNLRATKIDGTLHNLCEFHRRKANQSQQRLHKRHRDERVARRRSETTKVRTHKKTRRTVQSPVDPTTIDPIPFAATEVYHEFNKFYPPGFFSGELSSQSFTLDDMDILELLLLDPQARQTTPQDVFQPNSPMAVDDNFILV